MLLFIWVLFARDRATDLDLAFASFVFLFYFSLVVGGITFADRSPSGEQDRSLGDYMRGRIDTYSGSLSGRAAAVQMLFLPSCMMLFIITFGIIVHFELPN